MDLSCININLIAMTISKDSFIKIPTWIIVVLTPIFIAAATGFITNLVINSKAQKQIEVNTKKLDDIPVLIDRKVDKDAYVSDIQNVKESLKRIETKLDQHIERK
jgi:hypothetical protein